MKDLLMVAVIFAVFAIPGVIIISLFRWITGGKKLGENLQGNIDISWLTPHHVPQEPDNRFLFEQQEILLDLKNDDTGAWFQVMLKDSAAYPSVFNAKEIPENPVSVPLFNVIPQIMIQKMSRLDKLGKRLGLEADVSTGFPSFDQQVYIQSLAPKPFVRTVFSSQSLREAVLDLLNDGWSGVYLYHPKTPVLLKHINNNPTGQEYTVFERQLRKMLEIRSLLPSMRSNKVEKTLSHSLLFIFGGVLWGFAGLFLQRIFEAPTIVEEDMTQVYAIGVGLISIVPFILIWRSLVGSHRALRTLIFTTIGLLFGNMFVSHMLVGHLNATLDSSIPTMAEAPIVQYGASEGSEGAMYYRFYIAETEHNAAFSISVGEELFYERPKGIQMQIGEGALGYRWLVQYKTTKEKPKP